ncbi:hypothetical protein [Salinisphaera sp.]|uniref:hypothetical protein n=1 Tax=Salinisphaera sp. TaxID=1914330 RepID=UPI0025F4F533|nr:hypothetical protein [Salinisphaera sp.]
MPGYRVFSALERDIGAPFVWITDPPVPSRSIAKIKNTQTGQHVYCEVLVMDVNFRAAYNGSNKTVSIQEQLPAIVANAWYRQKLGVEKNQESTLEFSIPKYVPQIVRQIRAAISHPDSAVRLSANLAVISVALGFVGLLLGIVSIIK